MPTIKPDTDGNYNINSDTDGRVILDDLKYPKTDGVNGEAIITDGSGNLTFGTSGSGEVDQNLWETISSDSGSVAANITTDTLTVAGGTGISTAISGDTLTVTNDSPNVAQNLWETISSDSGSVAANTTTDTLTVAGGTGISTAISSDTLTVTNDSPNVAQNLWETILGDSGSTAANITTDTLSIIGGTGITTVMSGDTLTITNSNPTGLDNIVEDITPQLGADLDVNNFGLDDTNGNELVTFTATASADTQINITNGIGNAYIQTTSDAVDANLYLTSKGGAFVNIGSSYFTDALLISSAANTVNGFWMRSSLTGNPVIITALGADTNVGIIIVPKGFGDLILDGLRWPQADGSSGQVIKTNGSSQLSFTDITDLGEFTIANLPAASSSANSYALATDASGGRTIVRSDGTNWKIVVVEGATVS